MSDLARAILGGLILCPGLLEAADITEADFPAGRMRRTFQAVTSFWEESKPAEIDCVLLAEAVGGNGAMGFVGNLLDGQIRLEPEAFRGRVLELRRRALTAQLRKALPTQDGLQGLDLAKIRSLVDRLENLSNKDSGAPDVVNLADIKPRVVPWLWENYIAFGRATLISGDPGCGKSWFCLDLAARLSRGRPWADGSPGSKPGKTLYLSVEDDLHDTVRPRVDALGGDPKMIGCYNPDSNFLNLGTADGLHRLETETRKLGDVRLVIIDPIIDFSGLVNPNATEEVRALLAPIIALSNKLGFALLLVGHLNKNQSLSAIYRTGGTTSGWLGKCRAAFLILRNVDEKTLRHVIPLKANLSRRDPQQLEFRLENDKLNIGPATEDVDPDEQLNPQRGPRPREREDAVAWLNAFFAERDEVSSNEVEAEAAARGISIATLRRAKKSAGFSSYMHREDDGRSSWVWRRGK